MGGFAALLGGLGAGAQAYGQQVRNLLEARRTNLGEFLMNMATQERDPQLRAEYMGHASKVFSGDPMAKVLPGIAKTVQGHVQDNAILAQIFAPRGQQQPQTRPGQALGQVPAQIPEPGTAAQAPTSPVAPTGTAQAGPLPTAPGAPSISDIAPLVAPPQAAAPPQPAQTAAVQAAAPVPPAGLPTGLGAQSPDSLAYDPWEDMARLTQLESHLTPAMGAAMQAPIQQMVQHVQQLGLARNEMEIKSRALPSITAPLQQIINDPNAAPMMKALAQNSIARWQGWAVTPGATVTPDMMNMSMLRSFRPVKTVINVDKTPVPNLPGMAGELHGNHIFMTDPWDGSIQSYVGGAPEGFKEGMQQGEDGVWRLAAYLPGQGAPGIAQPGITPPSQAKPVEGTLPGGQIGTTTPAEIRAGVPPRQSAFVNPSTIPSYSFTPVTQEGPGGTEIVKPMPMIRGKIFGGPGPGVGGVGAPQGGGGIPAGPGWTVTKPVTPQRLDMDRAQIGQMNQAIDLAQDIINKAPVLNSLLSSHKIEWALEGQGILNAKVAKDFPGAGMLSRSLTRAVQYTPEELDVLNDFNSLRESVNILRNALGGGFRGTEAFNTLQNLRGDILQNPEITKSLLRNLIREIQIQAGPLGTRTQIPVHGAQISPKGELMGGLPQATGAQAAPKIDQKKVDSVLKGLGIQ